MKIFTKKEHLSDYLGRSIAGDKIIGLVPTMGALHKGHISLIHAASDQSDIVICSIFVNPTQFNDPEDLKKYPRPIEEDIKKLQAADCDVLFMPDVIEMYHGNEAWHIDLGDLGKMLEAKSRPGHYQGVTQIVKKLLDAVNPDLVFLGQKDYQQFLVIDKMVTTLNLPSKLVLCPIVREDDGLAMSSRNMHLSGIQRKQARAISQALFLTKRNFGINSIEQLKAEGISFLNNSEGIRLDYFEVCNIKDLQPATSKESDGLIALTAAYIGNIRLIDNIILT